MNENCKYCNYVSNCSQFCEYNSVICKLHRSFPKIVSKSYEELEVENQQLKSQLEQSELNHKQLKDLELAQSLNSWQTEKLIKLEQQLKQSNNVISKVKQQLKNWRTLELDDLLVSITSIEHILNKRGGTDE